MTDSDLIDKAGGTKRIAQLCRVTAGAVSQWRNNGIPPVRRMFLELARPKVFGKAAIARAQAELSEKDTA